MASPESALYILNAAAKDEEDYGKIDSNVLAPRMGFGMWDGRSTFCVNMSYWPKLPGPLHDHLQVSHTKLSLLPIGHVVSPEYETKATHPIAYILVHVWKL